MNNLILSIIIPVYNVEKYIKKCLVSIIEQTKDIKDLIEVIIINDGSTDLSLEIINNFKTESFIHIVSQKNQGLSIARNTGLSIAKGTHIWFVDSDDCIAPHAIEKIFQVISKEKFDILGLDIIKIKEINNEKVKESVFTNKKFYKYYNYYNSGTFFEGKIHQGIVQRYIFNLNFLKKHNVVFMKGIYHEDLEFMVKCMLYAQNIICKPIIAYEYLIRESGSIMSTLSIKSIESKLIILYSWENLCKQNFSKHQKAAICDSMFNLASHMLLKSVKDIQLKKDTILYLKKIALLSYIKAFKYYFSLGRSFKLIKLLCK